MTRAPGERRWDGADDLIERTIAWWSLVAGGSVILQRLEIFSEEGGGRLRYRRRPPLGDR